MLIDSHAHLDDPKFNKDRDRLIKSLKQNDISLVINVGADVSSSIKSVKLADEYENIYAAVGVHPHSAKEMDDSTIDVLKAFAKRDKVVAIGEIGLDFHYDNSPRDIQRKWFIEQIKLAKELDMPIIVHSRDADQETFDILKEEADERLRGVLHCYSGSAEMAKDYIDLGFYISLAGPVTFKNARKPKEVAKVVPMDKLLIETDSPYLTPEPHRGKRNEPLYVRHVASMIAELRGMDFEDVGRITSENTKRLFNID
ncbi:TatD family hydrolase [Anaerosalibacter bizertensis]|uniref:TatD family hydrolase n=1 Tax=Anaerosalibacter bizertensis TaxID=932217 RepID=A0A9Q4FM53_9FIRM|nr:TatD family hydrolase [Anaerosalibacter bizertensis]MBV1819483.1 TatD family hydrolase [Bacteroidales bacterium MSK.15.36]MCB5560027.1 TatD family hydrolase [Anaerosalibacter bizertensis]MCG4565315.1 TatD family hydrolase [Anaerosalibacter bizertensis]MCG4582157.1 TatD family hydrolase [Anaerosalibacter bizertensis]MCG4585719.1 TatD family hydrolase [Anaerosalibacter bizertensis]